MVCIIFYRLRWFVLFIYNRIYIVILFEKKIIFLIYYDLIVIVNIVLDLKDIFIY